MDKNEALKINKEILKSVKNLPYNDALTVLAATISSLIRAKNNNNKINNIKDMENLCIIMKDQLSH